MGQRPARLGAQLAESHRLLEGLKEFGLAVGGDLGTGEDGVDVGEVAVVVVVLDVGVHPLLHGAVLVEHIGRDLAEQSAEALRLVGVKSCDRHALEEVGQKLLQDSEVHGGVLGYHARVSRGGVLGGDGGVEADVFPVLHGVVQIEQGGLPHEGEDLLPQEGLILGVEIVLPEVAAEPARAADPVEDHRNGHTGSRGAGGGVGRDPDATGTEHLPRALTELLGLGGVVAEEGRDGVGETSRHGVPVGDLHVLVGHVLAPGQVVIPVPQAVQGDGISLLRGRRDEKVAAEPPEAFQKSGGGFPIIGLVQQLLVGGVEGLLGSQLQSHTVVQGLMEGDMILQKLVVGLAHNGIQGAVRAVGAATDQDRVIRARYRKGRAVDGSGAVTQERHAGGRIPLGGGAVQAAFGGLGLCCLVVEAEIVGSGKGRVGGHAHYGHVGGAGHEGLAAVVTAVYGEVHEGLARLHIHPAAVLFEDRRGGEGDLQPAYGMGAIHGGGGSLLHQGVGQVLLVGGGVVPSVQSLPHFADGVGHVGDLAVVAPLPQVVAVEGDYFPAHRAGDEDARQAVTQREGLPPQLLGPGGGLFQGVHVSAHTVSPVCCRAAAR